MKKIGFIIFAVALVVGVVAASLVPFGRSVNPFKFSVNFGGVHGSGHTVTEKRSIDDFTAVETGGIFQVTIIAQKEYGVEVEADDNLMPLIATEVSNGVLRIETEKHFKSSNPIRVRISAPDIERLDVSGVANVTLSNLKNANLDIEASGASKVTVSGETSRIGVDVSGASKIIAEGLNADAAEIDASGASHVSVNVASEIRSDLSGASRVVYSGSPASVITSKSGGSSITAK